MDQRWKMNQPNQHPAMERAIRANNQSAVDRHARRRSVPSHHQAPADDPRRSLKRPTASIDNTPKSVRPGQRKIEQVFFPPFEEASEEEPSITGEKKEEGWAKWFATANTDPITPNHQQGSTRQRSSSPIRRSEVTPVRWRHHRRTQSSLDTVTYKEEAVLRPSGISLSQLEIDPASSSLVQPADDIPKRQPATISPLTRRARRVLGESNVNNMVSPTEECSGGHGLVEAIRLKRLLREDVESKSSKNNEVPARMSLHRSTSLPISRHKRKAVPNENELSSKRYPTPSLRVRTCPPSPPSTEVECGKVKNRPPPLRNLPPPSWSSPGPSPPLTSLATPFSTDMFVMPFPNPVATLTPGLLSPNYTPPHSPRQYQPRSVPITPRSDPIDDEDWVQPTQPRIRRRSSLQSFESTTETIRPWHVGVELTPKPSRAQLNAAYMDPLQSEPAVPSQGVSSKTLGLQLETLAADWDIESDEERGRLQQLSGQRGRSRRPDRAALRENARRIRMKVEGRDISEQRPRRSVTRQHNDVNTR